MKVEAILENWINRRVQKRHMDRYFKAAEIGESRQFFVFISFPFGANAVPIIGRMYA